MRRWRWLFFSCDIGRCRLFFHEAISISPHRIWKQERRKNGSSFSSFARPPPAGSLLFAGLKCSPAPGAGDEQMAVDLRERAVLRFACPFPLPCCSLTSFVRYCGLVRRRGVAMGDTRRFCQLGFVSSVSGRRRVGCPVVERRLRAMAIGVELDVVCGVW